MPLFVRHIAFSARVLLMVGECYCVVLGNGMGVDMVVAKN